MLTLKPNQKTRQLASDAGGDAGNVAGDVGDVGDVAGVAGCWWAFEHVMKYNSWRSMNHSAPIS